MQLTLDTEQQELRSGVREFAADHAPSARIREVMDSSEGYDHDLWRRLATELDVLGLVVPEAYGGSGAGHVERCVVLEELGRVLAPVPFLASAVLAADTLLALDDEQARAEFLPPLATGERIGAVAVEAAVRARRRDGDWVLDGSASPVVSGDVADLLLVPAELDEGTGWFLVHGDASGLDRAALRTLDPTRRMTRFDFAGVAARRLYTENGAATLSAMRERATVALAAEQVGGMQRALEMTVDYAKVRVQFGRTIGSYQAVKHACADMYSEYEQAFSILRYAAWTADHDPAELPLAAAMTQVLISPAYFRSAADMVQLHGGIGYTWEHDAHLYYKRAKTSELLLGTPQRNQERLADLLCP